MAEERKQVVRRHTDLEVYQRSFDVAMKLFQLSRDFPLEERYSLTDQMRRSSRSVCANLAEAWRKRMYRAAFLSKLCDCEAEAAETQVWIQFAVKCEYLHRESGASHYSDYDDIIGMLVNMIVKPEQWLISSQSHPG